MGSFINFNKNLNSIKFLRALTLLGTLAGCQVSSHDDSEVATQTTLSHSTTRISQAINLGSPVADSFQLNDQFATFSLGSLDHFPVVTDFLTHSTANNLVINVDKFPWPAADHDSVTSIKGFLLDEQDNRYPIFLFSFFGRGANSGNDGDIPVASLRYDITADMNRAREDMQQKNLGLGKELRLAIEIDGSIAEDVTAYFDALKLVPMQISFE